MHKKKLFIIISNAVAGIIVLALIISILSLSFGSDSLAGHDMAQSIKLKYEQRDRFSYTDPLFNVAPDHVLAYNVKFDPAQKGLAPNQIADVFLDADLTVSVDPQITYNSETDEILISPPRHPVLLGDSDFWDEPGAHWGYAPQFYAAQFYNSKGKELDKPVVTVFTLQNDLKAPEVEYYKQNGCLGLKWAPVAGAETYQIYKVTVNERDGIPHASMWWLDETKDTDLVYEGTIQLELFNIANIWLHDDVPYYICVQAVNGEHASPVSNPVYSEDIVPIVPYMAVTSGSADDSELSWVVDNIEDVGIYKTVRMLDGSEVQMPVSYDIDSAVVLDASTIIDELDETVFVLYIPFDVVDTLLNGCVMVKNYDKNTMRSDLEKLKEREKDVLLSGGRLEIDIDLEGYSDSVPQSKQTSLSVTGDRFNITATNAFSEYLALHMLSGVREIDISKFDERFDADVMRGALLEAVYQNPLILGVSSFKIDKSRTTLFLTYEQSRNDQQRKQNELQTEARRVVGEIITPGMSDLDKEIAINNYLCDTVQYDADAFDSAAKYNFKKTDPAFYDSFTAYGALINKSGVCAGYSSAFKLLCDEADVQCIVVTGYLYGNIPHAWNRVLIDGGWMTVDSASNGNGAVPNAVLNIPDHIAKTVLVEDGKYISFDELAAYKGNNEDVEYYRAEGLYCPKNDVAKTLLKGLEENGRVALRTDYGLSDTQYNAILAEVMKKGGYGVGEIEGSHWLGVIYLAVSDSPATL